MNASLHELIDRVARFPHDRRGRRCSAALLDTLFTDLAVLAEPELVVEAGAHDARTSMRMAELLPAARIVAFEANPRVHSHFARQHDFPAHRVDYRHAALAEAPGTVEFHVIVDSASLDTDPLSGYSSLGRRVGSDWLGEITYERVAVLATSLDTEFRLSSPAPAVLWADVEGSARQVLQGARRFLDHCDLVKIEVEEEACWEEQWLAPRVLAELARHDLHPIARDAEHPGQYNVVLAGPRLRRRAGFGERTSAYLGAMEECLRGPR